MCTTLGRDANWPSHRLSSSCISPAYMTAAAALQCDLLHLQKRQSKPWLDCPFLSLPHLLSGYSSILKNKNWHKGGLFPIKPLIWSYALVICFRIAVQSPLPCCNGTFLDSGLKHWKKLMLKMLVKMWLQAHKTCDPPHLVSFIVLQHFFVSQFFTGRLYIQSAIKEIACLCLFSLLQLFISCHDYYKITVPHQNKVSK